MIYRVVFAPEASEDLEELLVYLIEKTGPDSARRYIADIEEYCVGFKIFPERGVLRNDLRDGLRVVGFKRKASIAFNVGTDTVSILRIFHRGRNIDAAGQDTTET